MEWAVCVSKAGCTTAPEGGPFVVCSSWRPASKIQVWAGLAPPRPLCWVIPLWVTAS